MGLFGTKKKELQPLITEADFDEVANYESALNFLVGLSGEDYDKVLGVAQVYRQADYEAHKILGKPSEPTTFINPPEPTAVDDEPEFIDSPEKPKGGKKK